MRDYECLKLEVAAGVCTIRLNRPEKKNAFSVGMSSDLAQALREADLSDDVRVIVVGAVGDVFSSGADLSLFLGQPPDIGDRDSASVVAPDSVHEAIDAVTKPLIAQVHGKAVGMGVTLLPHFDLVYASESSSFSTPFVKLGLVLEFGSSFSLPRLIGRQRANEMILRGKEIDAATAEAWGLVTRVFKDEEISNKVREIAEDIAGNPPQGVRKSKKLIRDGEQTGTFAEAIAAENRILASCYGSEENMRAAMAFFQERQAAKLNPA